MEFSDNVNYVVLSNNVDKKFMSKFGVYQIIDVLPFEKLKNNLEMFPSVSTSTYAHNGTG